MTEDDPIVSYLIIRESLEMSVGKIAAQSAHASKALMIKFFRSDPSDFKSKIFNDWLRSNTRVVALKADDKEWEKVKAQFDCSLIKDAGFTEVEPGSETAIMLWPMRKSEARKTILKRLQAL